MERAVTRTNATPTAIAIPIIKEAIAKGIETKKAACIIGQKPFMTSSTRASVINGRESNKLFNTDIFTKELFT